MSLDEFIRRAMPVPFLDRGRTYEGWDCWGLVFCALRDVAGVLLPDYSDLYADAHDLDAVSRAIAARPVKDWLRIDPRQVGALDAVLMNYQGHPVHIGLAVDSRHMLHAFKGGGTVRERIFHPMAPGRVEGIYRYAA